MKSWSSWLVIIGVVAIVCILPLVLSPSLLTFFFLSFLWLILAANYDILGGFLGYVNLAQGAFFGIGAYAATILLNLTMVQALGGTFAVAFAMLCALILTGLFAGLLAVPLFRIRGLYFAIATLVLVFLLLAVVTNVRSLTGGSYGVFVPTQYFISTFNTYYLALILALISLGMNFYLSRSKIGLAFVSIREDEEAASSIGLNATRYKVIAFVFSSLPSSAAGVIFALNSGFIDPMIALGVERSLMPPLMSLLGGEGLVFGPLLGMVIIRVVDVIFFQYLILPIPSMVLFGVVLMLVALFIPEGLLNTSWIRRITKGLMGKLKSPKQVEPV